MEGVDYSWARPGGATLARAGKRFAVRYLYPDGQGGKGLDASELTDLQANGIEVPVVYEMYAGRAKEGQAAGRADATSAQNSLRVLGLPAAMPIYFAVDYDAPESDQAAIDAYLRGAAEIIGANRVGVYGGFYIVKRCAANGSAAWFWQTYAWSGGQWFSGNHLEQYSNGQNLNGAVDFCRSKKDNYGQPSKFGGVNPPAPAPNTSPQPQSPPQTSPTATYTVRSGDTLSGIAGRFGTTVAALVSLNGIKDPNLIFPGQILHLAGTTSAPASSGRTYTVVSGDTLIGIAQRFGTNYQTLAAFNGIADPNKINVGQVLRIPGTAAAGGSTYLIKSGDTLSGIASRYNTSVATLQRLNSIPDANRIYAGQVLRLP